MKESVAETRLNAQGLLFGRPQFGTGPSLEKPPSQAEELATVLAMNEPVQELVKRYVQRNTGRPNYALAGGEIGRNFSEDKLDVVLATLPVIEEKTRSARQIVFGVIKEGNSGFVWEGYGLISLLLETVVNIPRFISTTCSGPFLERNSQHLNQSLVSKEFDNQLNPFWQEVEPNDKSLLAVLKQRGHLAPTGNYHYASLELFARALLFGP